MSVAPLVARSERHENRCSALLTHVVDELLQVPAKAVDELIGSFGLTPIDMTGIGCTGNLTTLLIAVDRSDVVVAELDEHIVAGLDGVVDALPPSLVEEGAAAASGLCGIVADNLLFVEDGIGLRAQSPHAFLILISIFHGTVAGEPHYGLSSLALHGLCRQGKVMEHRLQWLEGRVVTGGNALSSRAGVHHCSKTAGVDMILIEIVFLLPLTKPVELGSRDLVQVNEGHTFLGGNGLQPLRVDFPDDLSGLRIVGITRRERHENGMCAGLAAVVDKPAHILAIGIDRLLDARLLDGDVERVVSHAGDGSPRASTVVRSVVVVSNGDDDPVAGAQCFAHVGP